ncbi:cholesterol 25-hydroxylase [Microcaecilia unicolor]|uniref:Cholesterol 25-hydroxylase n=1 Tax=Microcaecilia unicolor TaxID=1415580 RepID=A0A6P7YCX6_9AMPH|nr:cholesterol 25-hydroxylase [Microcaecilia unicolor]
MNCSEQSRVATFRFTVEAEQGAVVLQPLWDTVRARQDWLRSPFFPVSFSFAVYMSFCLPFILLDLLSAKIPALRKYKLQPHNSPTLGMMMLCLFHTIYNHIVFIFPVTVAHWYWRPVSLPKAAPEAQKVLLDTFACLLLFDFQSFVWHVVHHRIPWLYKTFHKLHHKHTSTSVLVTHYSSAWETLSLGFFAGVCPIVMKCHPMTEMIFFIVNIWLSVEDHSGYEFPWSLHKLVPFGLCGGPPHHDIHHMKFRSNYAPYFTHWDRLFGTLAHSHPEEKSK